MAERVVAPHRLGDQVADVIRRRLAIHRDFLADDFAFELDFSFGKGCVPDHVTQHIGEHWQQFRLAAALIDRLILGSAGVDLSTGVFDVETQFVFVAAAGRNVDRQRRTLRIPPRRHREARSVRELPPLVGCLVHDVCAISASASARSAGVVIFKLGCSDSTNFTLTPVCWTAETSSVTANPRAATF